MKKLFLLLTVLLSAFLVKAQTDITVGPKVGLNVTNISNFNAKNKLSFHLGGFVEFRQGDWAIQPELLYSRQGGRYKSGDLKSKVRVNYLNVPILAKWYVFEGLSVEMGPGFGIALNAKSKMKVDGETSKHKLKYVNTLAADWLFGASYRWDDFVISARYSLGISNVFERNKYDGNNKNRMFQFSVGYCFNNVF